MSIILERFGQLTLPILNGRSDISTATARTSWSDLDSGGAFDALGDAQARPGLVNITYTGTIVDDDDFLEGLTFQQWLDNARAYTGKAKRLYARTLGDEIRSRRARLLNITARRQPGTINQRQLTFTFESNEAYWRGTHHGGGWVLDAGIYLDDGYFLDESDAEFTLDSSPKAITLEYDGNAENDDCVLSILAQSANITALNVAGDAGTEFDYTGTINTNKVLEVDSGASEVLNDGADAYSAFALDTANHEVPPWIRITPDAKTITITKTGGGTTSVATFDYWDYWQ